MDGASVTGDDFPPERLAWATRLLVGGMLISALSLAWSSPLSFLGFAFFGVTLTAAGIAMFLWTIVAASVARPRGG